MRSWLKLGGLAAFALGLSLACSSNGDNDGDDDDDNDDNGTGGANVAATGGAGGGSSATGGSGTNSGECTNFEGLPSGCGTFGNAAKQVTVNTLLVVDKSGSMSQSFTGSGTSKWVATHDALASALDATKEQMRYGLEMFPAADVKSTCSGAECCTVYAGSSVDVAVDLGTDVLNQLLKALNDAVPGGGTPTAAALREARAYLTTGVGAALPGRKVVLLATDGGPNCNVDHGVCDTDFCTYNTDLMGSGACNPTGENCCTSSAFGTIGCLDDTEVVSAVSALRSDGINTIVLGISTNSAYSQVLSAMANEGGMPRAGTPSYYPVDSVQQLTQTIKDITIELVKSCDVPLQEAVTPGQVNVAVDCQVLRGPGSTSGAAQWEYVADPPMIRILGTKCSEIEAEGGGARRVDVLVGCQTVL